MTPAIRRTAAVVLVLGLAVLGSARAAEAATIIAPISGVINVGGPGFGTLTATFDQSGLLTNYISGVTDFDAYMALDPQHSFVFAGNEWFSNSGTTSASVTYNLGGPFVVDRLALWNEDASGIGVLNLFYSLDNITFTALALGLLPTDNPPNFNYGADVFAFAPTLAQYIRFDMAGCPQPDGLGFEACAIGEVAFSTNAVPEPATLLLLGTGLAAAGVRRRLRRRA